MLPAGAAEQHAHADAQANALHLRIKHIDTAEKNLISELDAAAPAPRLGRRRLPRPHPRTLHRPLQRTASHHRAAQALASHTAQQGYNPTLLDELPELATRLDELPERIQAGVFAAFDIQILWNPPLHQATFRATITDTTPGIVADLLTRASNDPGNAASTGTPDHAPVTSQDTFSVSPHTGICGELSPNSADYLGGGAS